MKIILPDGSKIYGHKKFKDYLWFRLTKLQEELRFTKKEYNQILKSKKIKKKKITNRWYIWKKDIKKLKMLYYRISV